MREWLDWLTRVRLLLVALILAVGVIWPRSVSNPKNRSLFPSADRVLDHARNNPHHFFALDTEFALAGRVAGHRRHGDGVGAGVRDGAARQLFRFVVPAGDHRREYFVFAEHRVHDCRQYAR